MSGEPIRTDDEAVKVVTSAERIEQLELLLQEAREQNAELIKSTVAQAEAIKKLGVSQAALEKLLNKRSQELYETTVELETVKVSQS